MNYTTENSIGYLFTGYLNHQPNKKKENDHSKAGMILKVKKK